MGDLMPKADNDIIHIISFNGQQIEVLGGSFLLKYGKYKGWFTRRGTGKVKSWGYGECPFYWLVEQIMMRNHNHPDMLFWYEGAEEDAES